MSEPRNAHPLTKAVQSNVWAQSLDDAHDLVPRHDRQPDVRQFPIDDMQVCTANAAGFDAQTDFANARLGVGTFLEDEWAPLSSQNHRFHDLSLRMRAMDTFTARPNCGGRAGGSSDRSGSLDGDLLHPGQLPTRASSCQSPVRLTSVV